MKRFVVSAVSGVLLWSLVQTPVQAGCVGPQLYLGPATAGRGESFTVLGNWFFDSCNDVVHVCPSGTACPTQRPTLPQKNIQVTMTYKDLAWTLATVDANARFSFVEALRVPADAPRGKVVLVRAGNVSARLYVAKHGSVPVEPQDDLLPLVAVTLAAVAALCLAMFLVRRRPGG